MASKISVVFLLSGVTAILLMLTVAGVAAYILRGRYRVFNHDAWYTNTAVGSTKPKSQWIKEDYGISMIYSCTIDNK
ncbi:hypothetical protein FSP39_001985 [Pinctada imbricata]|uniref:Uncharacterized protein n=1 Tax=Pinctada imbricata TaxID=66713 RepID=A0AA88YAU1_PINIB|nr:hypothetical protein FSP39_001985 [Pinctada imbricata]